MATLIVPEQVPSPTQDSETLYKAGQGLITNPKAVIKVLSHRNAAQRKLIRDTFQELYKRPLIDYINSKFFGNYGKAVTLWTYDPAERGARLLNEALGSKKIEKNEVKVIVEIVCASSPELLLAIRKSYCARYERSVEEDVIDHAPQSVIKMLLGLVSSYRCDGVVVNLDLANDEASKLQEAIKLKHLDEDRFVWILSTRNVVQLKATFESYNQQFGNHISEDIKDTGNGLLESLVKDAITCISSPEKHFVEVIKTATDGLGTNETMLTRAIVTRAEIDLMKVSEAYLDIYKISLDKLVEDETSGDYGGFLMALLGN